MADADSKVCRDCGRSLPLSCFYSRDGAPCGVRSECKECCSKRKSARYHATKVLRPQCPLVTCAHCGTQFTKAITNPPTNTRYCSTSCRFWAKVDKSAGDNGCWVWTAGKANFGYGEFVVGGGEKIRAHRWAYEETHGKIPNGLYACHRCDNPACCNPKHLFLGTPQDNVLDMVSKGRKIISPRGRETLSANAKARWRIQRLIPLTGRRGLLPINELGDQGVVPQADLKPIPEA
jgi:hypothetical protein